MNLGAVLDVIIGLVFTYFLLALIASGIQEVIAGVFQWRGTYLSKGIDVILSSSQSAAFGWSSIGEFLVGHFTWKLPPTPPSPDPAYPPADATPDQVTALASQRLLAVQRHPLVRGSPTGLPSYVSARNFGLALLEALRDDSKLPLLSQVERTVDTLPPGDLKRTLSLFLQDAGGDLDAFRAHVEKWFDDAMDRLSGVYTRISQYSMILLGLVLALALNVDSVRLARTLWQDSHLREQVAAAATKAAGHPPPLGAGTGPSPQETLKALEDLDLPIGWSETTRPVLPASLAAQLGWPPPARPNGSGLLSAVFGWLFTAAAVALGAPFWFSLLGQLTNIRNAGPKPEPSTAGNATQPGSRAASS